MKLLRALRLESLPSSEEPHFGRSAAFVGAGGKTTAIFQLARELQSKMSGVARNGTPQTPNSAGYHPAPQSHNPKILITATSHLGVWQIPLADHHIVAESSGEIGDLPEGVTLVTGPLVGDRTLPLNTVSLFWLREATKKGNAPLLIEADGSRGRPLKAPAAHEPPIPGFVETVVVVAGLSGLGKPISEAVFREEEFRRVGETANRQVVAAEMATRVLTHPDGGLKNIPTGARRIALLNQAETPELQSIGGRMARELLGHFDSVLVGSLHQNNFHTFERTAGIVLAAGESTRFGQPKQLLDWRGETFVHAAARKAWEAGLSPVIVVTGAEAGKVEEAVKGLKVKIVRNEDWQSGQASSIVSGIKFLPENTGGCVFLLADQPQIGVDVIRALVETHAQSLPSILAPLVLEEKRANPVLFDRVTFPDLLQLKGDAGGRAIFDKYKVEYLPWHDDALLLDVDTPEDYERLVRRNDIPPHDET